MTDKVLFVDDDPNILAGIKRQLRKKYDVHTAEGPESGLEMVTTREPFPVVVSDQRMPGMEGVEFLARVREISPQSIRIMLTGEADIKASIDAVNKGHVFRFLTKPCPTEDLVRAIDLGLEQYRLQQAEKELLRGTLRGSVTVLTEILSLVNPEAFGRSTRIKRMVRDLAAQFQVPDLWRYDMAAMLSQIGCVTLSESALSKLSSGKKLNAEEQQAFDMHPSLAASLLTHIPRLKEVSRMVAYQEKRFDGTGSPQDSIKGRDIPLGARILKVVLDFDLLQTSGKKPGQAFQEMSRRKGFYDPDVLAALEQTLGTQARFEPREVDIGMLEQGMILSQDIRTLNGMLVVSRGQEVSPTLLHRLQNFQKNYGLQEPVQVLIPYTEDEPLD
ncbi:MAG: HD domain-containing phosphohydrolase [Desulfohalobiaceae bacterium]